MLNFFFTLIIYPPILIIEIVFELFFKIFKNPGIALLGVSGAVTFLCLPLYMVAEKWQKTEREKQKIMFPMINNIKAVFKGDERFMILQEFYRQNHYHPVYALRSSFGILIQIPFFMAAYSYLSHLEILKGISFLFIHDLGAPDAFAHPGGFTINILPVLMTAINITSGILYTKGFPLKDKIQLFGMAGIFLILLYNSPAGLVIYWTMNNIFSLAKNVFLKVKNPLKAFYILSGGIILIFIFYLVFINKGVITKRLLVIGASSLFLFTPLFIKLINYFHREFLSVFTENPRKMTVFFILTTLAISVLTGLCIPSAVISSSPDEFSFIDSYTTPLAYLGNSLVSAIGLFMFWPLCIYFLFGKKIKSLIASLFIFLLYIFLINAFVFQGNYGLISNVFQFETTGVLNYPLSFSFINALVIFSFVFLIAMALKKKFLSQIISFGFIVVVTLGIFSAYNLFTIQKSFSRLEAAKANNAEIDTLEKIFSLSKDRPNIIVFMADCAINGFVKPIFDSRPELYDDFDGFVLYPNTVSFSKHTLMGVPPLWGGFEYTPMEMNKRNDVSQRDKHNEALKLLPVILTENGYDVTVTDPSWSNYEWISDISIYNDLENTKAYNTIGHYTSYWFKDHEFGNTQVVSDTIKRNSLFFSFLKIAPPAFRFVVYDKGHYWGAANSTDFISSFIDNYALVDYLPALTSFGAEKSQALLITSELTHQPYFLQYPDYVPVPDITDQGPGNFNKNKFFHSNAAMLLRLSAWLRELKKYGVYDNTRIIIAADHGAGGAGRLVSDKPFSIPGESREGYNPLLLVKDFNSRGKLSEDNSFMTNADVPLLALKSVVNNPVNPFTGKPLTPDYKKNGVYLTINHQPMAADHGKNAFKIRPDQWIFVKDDIKESDNWKSVEP